MAFREFVAIIMFSFAVCFVGFAVVILLMKRRSLLRDGLALLVGDVGLMSLCNTVYFHSAVEKPGPVVVVVIFAILCLFSPLVSEFYLDCLLGARNRLGGLRRVLRAGTALAFAAGVTVAILTGAGDIQLVSYGWMFVSLLLTGVAGWRECRRMDSPPPACRSLLWLLWGDSGIVCAMFVASALDLVGFLIGLWIVLTGSAIVAFFIAARAQEQVMPGRSPVLRGRYEHSKLDNVRVDDTIARLERTMREEKFFCNPDLRLGDVARHVGINSSQLSELINLHMGLSFSEYVNRFRVEQARRELVEKPELAVIEIAFNCGFNSKSAFNSVFRKTVGMPPSEYRKQAPGTAGNGEPAASGASRTDD